MLWWHIRIPVVALWLFICWRLERYLLSSYWQHFQHEDLKSRFELLDSSLCFSVCMCWYWSPVCLVWRPLSFCPFLVSLSRRNLSLPSLPVDLNVHFSFLYYPLLPPSSFFLICASPPHLTRLVPVPILRCTFDKCALYFQTLALVGNTCRGNWSKHSFKIQSLWRRTSIQFL